MYASVNQDLLPVVEWDHPTRCTSCFAYINPYFTYLENGRKSQCNLCGFVSVVPDDQYAPLADDGLPIDKADRPYLLAPVCEFKVDADYNPTNDHCGGFADDDSYAFSSPPTRYVFIIDVSQRAYGNDTVSQTMRAFTDWMSTVRSHSDIAILLVSDKVHLVVKRQESLKPVIMTLNNQQTFCLNFPVPNYEVILDWRSYRKEYMLELQQIGAGIEPNPAPTLTQEALIISLGIAHK